MFLFNQKKSKGFTLIELLVAIAIIALLVAAIAIYFRTSRAKGRDSRRKGDLRQTENALILYQDDNDDNYPNSLNDLVPKYLPRVPTDPKTGVPHSYRISAGKNLYELNANLENNIDQSADIDGGNQPFPVYEVGSDLTLLP